MLRLLRLIVLLMASWEVAGDSLDGKADDTYFGCFKNVDAVCTDRLKGGTQQTLSWADRLTPGKRRYICRAGLHPRCCDQGKYWQLSYSSITLPAGGIPGCVGPQ
ncbi:hypothetical protein Pst134EB_022219 [Puccinia striiformis f. sp. tritici]|nr:hypothetical protein Pst134EB_022219 [Puccinia striiformis f. sp. tritici]